MLELRNRQQQGRALFRSAGGHRPEHEHHALFALLQQHGNAVQRQQVQVRQLLQLPGGAETDARQKAADDIGIAPETVQIHGAVQSTHQGVASRRVSARAAAVQHGERTHILFLILVL